MNLTLLSIRSLDLFFVDMAEHKAHSKTHENKKMNEERKRNKDMRPGCVF
jgi:hypothetical protein